MARACLGALKLFQGGASSPFSCIWVRHIYGGKRRKKFIDPFHVPTLYLGKELLPEHDPVIKPKPSPKPADRRNLNHKWRMLQKTRFVNANRKKMIAWYRGRIARKIALRVKRWQENAARLKEWKAEARAVYATKKITAIRGLPELLLEKHERPKRMS